MPADLVHLVRHGEVENPTRILYGQLEGFGLSELGHRMAEAAAASLDGRSITGILSSPLQRAQESAAPWAARFGRGVVLDERLIEPRNRFQGINVRRDLRRRPGLWPYAVNPLRPSWGESFASIRARMMSVIAEAHDVASGGEIVLVSHQLPIWMVARSVAGRRLAHAPRARRCTLSSITTLAKEGERFVEVDYQEPAGHLLAQSIDLGAV